MNFDYSTLLEKADLFGYQIPKKPSGLRLSGDAALDALIEITVRMIDEDAAFAGNRDALRVHDEILTLHLLKSFSGLSDGSSSNWADRARAMKARDFILANLASGFSLTDVAIDCGCSVRSVQFSFRKTFDMSISEFVLRSRMELFHEIVRASRGEISVTHASLQAGFTHLSEFNRRYRRLFLETPGQAVRRIRFEAGTARSRRR